MNRARSARCIGAIVLILLLWGCGNSSSDRTVTTTINNRESPPPSAQTLPRSSDDAVSLVRRYYDAVNRQSYEEAWALLAPALQDSLGGYSAWRNGYRFTESTELTDVRLESSDPATANVAISLRSTDLDACGDEVTQSFAGTWTVESSTGGGQATDFSVQKLSGGTPLQDPAACGPPPTTTTQPADCDPNYSGACLNPSSPDYDCEGGSGDGPDYTGTVTVVGDDHFGLDSNSDGIGCEP